MSVDSSVGSQDYGNTYGRLLSEAAVVIFEKKDGNIRVMLSTRNADIATLMWPDNNLEYLLAGFDRRCNRSNGNLAVIDVILGDCRSFNINRVIGIKWLGEITRDTLEDALAEYENIEKELSEGLGYSVVGGDKNNSGAGAVPKAIKF